jgi:hypothetical protein
MRFDGVEIKVTLAGEQTGSAVQRLGLPPDHPRWRIYFCEDVTEGGSAVAPLLAAGVVLRARDKAGGKDDVTVKLRPCRRSQLTHRWLAAEQGETEDGDEWEVKVEADWSGARRVLAASHTTDRREGTVGREWRSAADLLVAEQQDFLRDCAPIAVNLETVTLLPPVTAVRWRSVDAAPAGLDPRAERWTVDDLDFLELSVSCDLDQARSKQDALTGFLRSLDLPVDPDQPSKTRRVVEHLVARAVDPR